MSTYHSTTTKLSFSHRERAGVRVPPTARRGVLLLVVLILLVMFVMMAVTYVLVASKQLSNDRALARAESTGDPPAQQLDNAMMQVLRGSTNPRSALYPHSLLEHMYGPYGLKGSVTAIDPNGNFTRTSATDSSTDQILEFTAGSPAPVDASFYTPTSKSDLLTVSLHTEGYLDGCVITMTSGPAVGLSSRIVRYDATTPTDPVFHVLPFKSASGGVKVPLSGDTFLINGRAFSGTGVGFNPTSGVLDAVDAASHPFALLPNAIFYYPSGTYGFGLYPEGMPFGGPGGANTDYDAPDYQHMAMSWTVMNAAGQAQTILPSFHRPDLINYWSNQSSVGGNWVTNHNLLNQVMLRPMGNIKIAGAVITDSSHPSDHPNFTGSNPNFDAISGPWDVDNDGDGVADSVWIDAGFPAQASSNGKMYKPLVAILCVDLDGRLNVNAAGTTEQLSAAHSQPITGPYAGTNTTISLPRGLGIGPAEINLFDPANPTVQSPLTQTQALQVMRGGTIVAGTTSYKYDGRYTESGNATAQAGSTGNQSLMGEVMRFQYPDNTFNPPSNIIAPLSSFGSPADLWGRMAIGLDYRGQPLYWKSGWTDEALNCPYDLNLNAGGASQASSSQADDNPFGATELERLCRQFDVDSAGLPRRLWDVSGMSSLPIGQAQQISRTLTTDSWDAPSPGVIAPDYLRDQLNSIYGRKFATNIIELLTARLLKDNPTWTTTYTPSQLQAVINQNIRALLSPELIAGLRMNINRPLGDGRDSDDNKVVDEPTVNELGREGQNTPTSSNPWVWLDSRLAAAGFQAPPALDLACGIDVNGDGVVNATDQLLARQLFARHLYVLARLMIDDPALQSVKWFAKENGLTSTQIQDLAVRRIAQWAINVVDNMDPDNIMTPFEYDRNPFTNDDPAGHPGRTWEVDGVLDDGSGTISPDDDQSSHPWRRLVWGCEQPSLLITETMALHDRRVADTSNDTTGKDRSQTPNPDADLDQVRIPEGSLFVELYATHNPNNPTASGDLYVRPTNTSPWCLNLEAMAPSGNDGYSASAQYPVWRLAISKPHKGGGTTTPSPRPDPDVPNSGFAVSNPCSASLEPEQVIEPDNTKPNYNASYNGSLLNTSTGTQVQLDRYIWFRLNQDPTLVAAHDADRVFWARQVNNATFANKAYIQPGGYVVVGPRDQTWFGSLTTSEGQASTWMQKWGVHSPAGISLSQMAAATNGVTAVTAAGVSAPSYPDTTQIQKPVTIVAAANPPTTWANTNFTAPSGIGISVSEPLPNQPSGEANRSDYYREPINKPNAANNNLWDAYDDLQSPNGTFPDSPFESARSAASGRIANAPVSLLPSGPKTGTTMNYRTVFLQRLANPLVAYHPLTNPYLTVDWMPVDLTVFNGEDRKPSGPTSWDDSKGPWDPDDVEKRGLDNYNDLDTSVAFSSRQRGQFSTGLPRTATNPNDPTYTKFNLWSQWPDPSSPATVATPAALNKFNLGGEDPSLNKREDRNLIKVNFRFNLNDTVAPIESGIVANAGVGNASLGFLNHSYGPPRDATQVNGYSAYVGDPQQPFPWVTWNNRPYANIAELMLVPATHPGRLLNEYSIPVDRGGNLYTSTNSQLQAFPYLLNFFDSGPSGSGTNLSQMFEYLQVPSPFVGTQQALNPTIFAGNWWTSAGAKPGELSPGTEPTGTAGLHPPFNFVSNYRDPGKVNINTVNDASVWNAVIGGDPTVSGNSTFADVTSTRQGYSASIYSFGPDSAGHYFPSIFSNPFRSAAGADMVPLQQPLNAGGLTHRPTSVTLWRAGVSVTQDGKTINTAGLPYDPDNSANTLPLFTNKSDFAVAPQIQPAAYNDGSRNPYFRYQGLENVTGKLTTRSNVYAVWITVGYFEVTPWYGTAGGTVQIFDNPHPDGYQLGQEVGADSGQIQRHRAFYIIDRSIPVGFQRGYDNNDSNAVILKRFIE